MITTLLLDLDDTLLDNDMADFLPAYLRLLAERMAVVSPAERFNQCLMAGTQAMVRNTDPEERLEAALGQVFYSGLQVLPENLTSLVDQFYAEDFPKLRSLTRRLPAARKLMDWAVANGLEVAITTNPLFPRTAIEQRLDWAGIPAGDYPYVLIASYETFRFAKPHPEFITEALARINRCPTDVLCVGDLWANDIQPAEALGINSWWVHSGSPDGTPENSGVVGSGSLDELVAWLEAGSLASLPPRSTPPSALPALLTGDLAAVLDALHEARGADWTRRPAQADWSAGEILCHLRDVEREVHFPRIQLVASEDNPFVSAVDSDVWAEERGYAAQDPRQALKDYVAERKKTLEFLRGLAAGAWSRPCRHAIFGPTTLAEITSLVSDHDRLHLEQLRATLRSVGGSGGREAAPSAASRPAGPGESQF